MIKVSRVKGDTGPAGTGVTIVGSVVSETDLDMSYSGSIGDMYITSNTVVMFGTEITGQM